MQPGAGRPSQPHAPLLQALAAAVAHPQSSALTASTQQVPPAPGGSPPVQTSEAKQEVRQKLAQTLQLISSILVQSVQKQSSSSSSSQQHGSSPDHHQHHQHHQQQQQLQEMQQPRQISLPGAQVKRSLEMVSRASEEQPADARPSKVSRLEECPANAHGRHGAGSDEGEPCSAGPEQHHSSLTTGSSGEGQHEASVGLAAGWSKESLAQSNEEATGASEAQEANMAAQSTEGDSEMLPPPLLIPRSRPPRCPSSKKGDFGTAAITPTAMFCFADELPQFCLSPGGFPLFSAPSPTVLSPSGGRARVQGFAVFNGAPRNFSPRPALATPGLHLVKREGSPWHSVQPMGQVEDSKNAFQVAESSKPGQSAPAGDKLPEASGSLGESGLATPVLWS